MSQSKVNESIKDVHRRSFANPLTGPDAFRPFVNRSVRGLPCRAWRPLSRGVPWRPMCTCVSTEIRRPLPRTHLPKCGLIYLHCTAVCTHGRTVLATAFEPRPQSPRLWHIELPNAATYSYQTRYMSYQTRHTEFSNAAALYELPNAAYPYELPNAA